MKRSLMSMTFSKAVVLLFIVSLVLSSCSTANKNDPDQAGTGEEPAKDITITFGVTPWTSTVPPTQIARLLLESMGYTVKLQNADVGVVYTGLARGDIDVFMDAWLPDMHKNYMDKYRDKINDTAVSFPNGELGWVVPKFVKDINSVDEIKGNEDLFGQKIYGIEEGAGMTIASRDMIKDYELNLEYVASSEAGMLTQAKKMIDGKKPVLFLGWRPHPMFVDWDLKVLKDPKGYFKTSEVHVLTNNELKARAPEAYAFLSKWSIPVEDIEQMIVAINSGSKPEDVANKWIRDNQDKVNKMIDK